MQRRIKVLECIRQGKVGGGESHLLSLVEYIDRTRFEPVVLSFTDGPMMETLKNLNVKSYVIHTEKPFDFTVRNKVKQLLIHEKIELIHAHGTRANSNIIWAARSLNIPVVYTIHGWSYHQDQNFLLRNLRIMGEKYLTSRTNVNISVSESNKKSGKHFLKKFESTIIHYGIDTKKFDPKRQYHDVRSELGLPKDKILLSFVARFTSHKQPLALIKAFTEAIKKNTNLHLLMVGDGDQKQEGIEMVKKAGIESHVTFEKFRQDVPAVLAATDIFILPSLWEGLPIALLEAMMMGKAIIASNVDGTCDVIRHNENGMLVETDNLVENLVAAILKLSNDPGLMQKFERNAEKTVREHFEVVKMTRRIEKLYNDVVSQTDVFVN